MTWLRIIVVFTLAALAEIGGAWLVWQAVRENRSWWLAALGCMVLAGYGFVACLQPDANFARIMAAYGGIFIAASLLWGRVVDGFEPTRWDITGAAVALAGAGIIIFAPLLTHASAGD